MRNSEDTAANAPYAQRYVSGLASPVDTRDWEYVGDARIQDDEETPPRNLDLRKTLQPVRDQGAHGSCFAMAAACMKELQENVDYGLDAA